VAVFYQVKFTTDHRFDVPFAGFVDELEGAEHITVISQCYALHTVSNRLVHHRTDLRCTVEEGVLGVAVEVAEFHLGRLIAVIVGRMIGLPHVGDDSVSRLHKVRRRRLFPTNSFPQGLRIDRHRIRQIYSATARWSLLRYYGYKSITIK